MLKVAWKMVAVPGARRDIVRRAAVGVRGVVGGRSRIPAFVHIPKTGGSYLGQFQRPTPPVLWPMRYFGHCSIGRPDGPYAADRFHLESKAEVASYFVFSVCRNPFDWLVSYAAHAGGWNPKYRNENDPDFELANGEFPEFVKRVLDREDRWPNRRMLHYMMFADDGEFMVNWVLRNETLDDDAEALARHVGARFRRTERTRVGKRPDYREMFTDPLVELVEGAWGDELRLLGYSFDGPAPEPRLKRLVPEELRRSIRYAYERDALEVGGAIAAPSAG